MGIKKCLLVFVFALCVSFEIFASLPVVKSAFYGVPNLKMLSSEHFDFIYPENLRKDAQMLQSKADDVLLELEEYFGVSWNYGKISVVLTEDQKQLNAYYSPFTNSHIVLYVTHLDNGDLLNFENTLFSVFEHEVSHYYIMKMHGSVMSGFSSVFGDYFCNGLFLPNYMIEGLAVAFESRHNAGRLNYPFATFILREAKSEQNFPHYRLLGGNLRTSPYKNLEYIAGGAFVAFIREHYGISKFYELIAGLKNMFSFSHLFFSVYGVSLDEAWAEFVRNIPNIDDAILSKSIVSEQGQYKFLKYRKNGLYYIDSVSSSVYRFKDDRVEKLAIFDMSVNSFDVTKDEKHYLLSGTYGNNAVTRVYEVESTKLISEFNGTRLGGFGVSGAKNTVLYVKDETDKTAVFSAYLDGTEIACFEFDRNDEVLAFSPFIKDRIAFVYKNGEEVALAVCDKNFNKMLKYKLDGITVQGLSLSYSDDESLCNLSLSFVYNENIFDSTFLPSIILFTFTENGELKKVEMSTENVKGGMLFPVLVNDDVFFVNTHFGFTTISKIQKGALNFQDVKEKVLISNVYRYGEKTESSLEDVAIVKDVNEKGYSRFLKALPFVSKGALVPFVFYDKKTEDYSLLPSLSYYTADSSESITSALHFTYLPYNNNIYGRNPKWFEINSIFLEVGMNFDILPFSLYTAFRPKFYFDKTTGTSISLDGYLNAEYYTYFSSQNHYLKTSLLLGYEKRVYGNLNIYQNGFYGDISVLYSNIHYIGYGYNQVNGFRIKGEFSAKEVFLNAHTWIFNASVYARYYHSRIIPIQNSKNLTYNLPFNVNFSAFYSSKGITEGLDGDALIFSNRVSLTPSISVILFAIDIENVLSKAVPITFNSFVLDVFTSFAYSHFDVEKRDTNHRLDINIGAEGYFTISAGFLGLAIESCSLDLGLRYEMTWRSDSMRNNAFYPIPLYRYGKISFICRSSF